MVANLNNQRPRCLSKYRLRQIRSGIVALGIALFCLTDSVQAQHFINGSAGTYTGPGLFQVKGNATGLPDTVTGTFEYFGANQTVPAINYFNLLLTGAGSLKSSQGGSFGILQTVNVAQDVTFQIQPSATLTLEQMNGRLTEDGVVFGKVSKSVTLDNIVDTSDFGGIGVSIHSGGTQLGETEIIRESGTSVNIGGIQRVFHVAPASNQKINGTISFNYRKDEVPVGYDTTAFELWRSIDNGVTWRRQRTEREIGQSRLSKSGFFITGEWTATDTLHLLGRRNYENDPDSMLAVGLDSLNGKVHAKLSPFTAQVTDIYGNPIAGVKVRFVIDSIPNGANGQNLTDTIGTTDSLGQVSTQLTLGNLRGEYVVTAQLDSIPTTQFKFYGHAETGVGKILIVSRPPSDSIKTLTSPITIEVRDSGNVVIPFAEVRFSVIPPTGSTTHRIIPADTVTDVNGRASAILRLGEKSGLYIVEARSIEDTSIFDTVHVTATHGFPALAWQRGAVALSDTIGRTLSTFVYAITDADTNNVDGRNIQFTITGKPTGSNGDTLINVVNVTGPNGEASVQLRLGDKVGIDTVRAEDPSVPNSRRFFTGIVNHGKAMKMIQSPISTPTDTISSTFNIGVTITDRGDNPVDSVIVRYSMSSPIGSQPLISRDSVMTDTIGRALVNLTLGDKVGPYAVQASTSSLVGTISQFNFTATNGVPQKLLAISGSIQPKPILDTLNAPIIVRITDRADNLIPNEPVNFTVNIKPNGSTKDSLYNPNAVTDLQGLASTQFRFGEIAGAYKILASSPRLSNSLSFDASARPGVPKVFARVSGDYQRKQILTLLDTAFTAIVRDIGGNPVPNEWVTFTIVDTLSSNWGYGLSRDSILTDSVDDATVDSVQTNAFGLAKMWLKFGSKKGDYVVKAKSQTLPDTITFSATALRGTAKTLAQQGNNQVGQVGDILDPFAVQLSDIGGNYVDSVRVTFSIINTPSGAWGDTLTEYTGLTDSLGQASTVLTLGDIGGVYEVKASVAGLKDTIFIAEAILIMGDVNHDNYLNIGDLTSIIDHIVGRRILTGSNFKKADMSPVRPNGHIGDGVIDINDAYVCIDSLVAGGWDPMRDWVRTYNVTSRLMKTGKVDDQNDQNSDLVTSSTDSGYIQLTHIGSRFTLENTSPIKGLQVVIYLKQPAILDTADVVFPRAKIMNVIVKSVGKEVTVILWNTNNTPIDTGCGAIFRLPVKLNANTIDSMRVLVSVDSNVVWRLRDNNGIPVDITTVIPRDWMLYQNYPNPFNPSTTIEYDVPEVAGKIPRVAIQIFNIVGQKVKTIEVGIKETGRYRAIWYGTNENNVRVASGVYFYRLLAGDYVSTKKMVLLK